QLHLLDADLLAPRHKPGDTAQLVTTWRIVAPLPVDRDAVMFTQILGPRGNVVAQQDRLDAPSWNWHPGDRFIQLHRIALPADLPPGDYRLIVGVYTTPDRVDAVLAGREPEPAAQRLPIFINGEASGDFFELPPLKVAVDE
ncbi:MAG: hypothetical protein GY831_21465, partial [Delftia sp.]|nr:hypothetical protein [Delftia sp.]